MLRRLNENKSLNEILDKLDEILNLNEKETKEYMSKYKSCDRADDRYEWFKELQYLLEYDHSLRFIKEWVIFCIKNNYNVERYYNIEEFYGYEMLTRKLRTKVMELVSIFGSIFAET